MGVPSRTFAPPRFMRGDLIGDYVTVPLTACATSGFANVPPRSFTVSYGEDRIRDGSIESILNMKAREHGFARYTVVRNEYDYTTTVTEVLDSARGYVPYVAPQPTPEQIKAEADREAEYKSKVVSIYSQLGIENKETPRSTSGYWCGYYSELCCNPRLAVDKETNIVTVELGYKISGGCIVSNPFDFRYAIIYLHKVVDKWVEFNKLFSKEVKDEC